MEHTTVVEGRSGIIEVTEKLVIKDFVEVMAAGFELGKTIDSNSFMVGDTPMNITVYPNGNSSKTKGHVGVDVGVTLFNTGDDDIRVKCQFITDVITVGFDYKDVTIL